MKNREPRSREIRLITNQERLLILLCSEFYAQTKEAGYFECDTIYHCDGNLQGEFIVTVQLVDRGLF